MVDTAQQSEVAYLPESSPPTNHGHTVASWTAMIGIILGSLIAAIAFLITTPWVFWVGMAVVLLAVVAGGVLRSMGFGQADATRKS